jgi:toxin ParE1/3/4
VGYEVVLNPKAADDLQDLVTYIARDKPDAAMRFGEQLLRHALALASIPYRGRPWKGFPKIRTSIYHPYLIFYEIDEQAQKIEILRFWHGNKDQRRLRFE